MPPLSHTPNGTSEMRCSRTDCCRRESSSSRADVQAAAVRDLLRQAPVSIATYFAVAPLQPVSGHELFDSVHQRPGRRNIVQRQVAIQAGKAQAAIDLRMDEDGLQLRPEKYFLAAMRDVERLDAHAIARQHQPASGVCPERHRKHAAQSAETLRVPFEKRAQDRLGIAVRVKSMAQLLQLGAHFEVVVDLAVEDDDGVAVFGRDGLVAVLEVDNFQAGRAQRADRRLVNALLVGSAVDQGRGGVPNAIRRWRPIFMSKANNSAQIDQSLDTELISLPRLAAPSQARVRPDSAARQFHPMAVGA